MVTGPDIARKYIEKLQHGDIGQILELFSVDAMVISPKYGTLSADEFYRQLLADTVSSELEIRDILESLKSNRVAIWFEYKWSMKNGKTINFPVVDVLDFNEKMEIRKLHIIYDARISVGEK